MKRANNMKHTLTLLTALLLAPLAAVHATDLPKPTPNILIILADDLKHHDLGFTGSKDIPTPHIDALCASGTHFTQAYCTAPLCAPSRAGLLTGRNQARFGFDFNPEPYVAEDQGNRLQHPERFKNGLPQSEKTLATRLKAAAYQTAWIGKWHLGEAEWAQPKNHGFEHCYGFLSGVQSYRPMTNLEAKRAGDTPPLNHCLLDNGKWVKNTGNITDMLGAEAARYISAANKEKPWFMYCAFNAPHGPHQPDPEREPKFAHITDPARRRLAATISHLDDAVGVTMKALADSGQRERTLVIFINDHGVSSPGEWSGGKGTMHEGGLRSLLFLSWPGHIAAGAQRHDRVSFLDVASTALAAAGIAVKPEMKLEGTDLLVEKPIPNRPLAWRMDEAFAFRDEGDWKLVGNAQRTSLYDLKADPLEKKDLSAENPAKRDELLARLRKWDAQNARPMWKAVSEGAKKPSGAENRKKREASKAKTMPQAAVRFKDAALVWNMEAASKLRAVGEAKLGVADNEGSDGFVAQFDGGHLALDDLGDVFDHGKYTLHMRVKPAGDTLDGTLFSRGAEREHMPVDFSAWRMPWGHLSTEGIAFRTSFKRSVAAGQGAVLDFYCPTPKPLTGWLDLTVRLTAKAGTPGELDLFVNGGLLFRNAEKLPGGLPFEFFLHETPGAIIGAQPGGRWPFRGLIDHVAIWRKSLSDAEVLDLAGLKHDGAFLKPQRLHTKDALGQYHLPGDTADEQRASLTNDELKKAITHQIAHDPWYPQYHIALVGLVCNLHSLYHGGQHHYMLIHRGEALNHNEVFRHLVSDDLVSWDMCPAPLGWPHPIWPNGTFMVGPDGKPGIVGGYPITLATAEDENLDEWKVRNDEVRITKDHPNYVSDPKAAPGKYSWEEGNAWKQDGTYYMVGAGSHWDRINEQGKLQRHHHDAVGHDFPLYRSADLREWQHVGSFFTNPDPAKLNLGVECGQMIPLADGRYLWNFTHTYLVGRIEDRRFIMQHHDTLSEKGNFVHWGGWERDDSGRILFQTTKILKLPVPELARLGWGRTHRLPLEAKVDADGHLTLSPAAELQKLRGKPHALGEIASAHQEVEISFIMPATERVGLRIGDGENSFDIFVDAEKRQLIFDPRKLPAEANHIPNDKRLFTQPLTAKSGEQVTLRVFLDGPLVEVFCNGLNGAHWAWFEKPDSVKASPFTSTQPMSATNWPLRSIWSQHLHQP
jgi:arylsulfatase A-like enzyme/sucrose-6-phosphate hydrolase SacC (GH32 family)